MAAVNPGSHRGWGISVIFGETENLGSSILAGHHTKLLAGVGLAEHWTGSLLSLKLQEREEVCGFLCILNPLKKLNKKGKKNTFCNICNGIIWLLNVISAIVIADVY